MGSRARRTRAAATGALPCLPLEPDFEVGGGDDLISGWKAGEGRVVLVLHGGPGLREYTETLLPELVDAYTVIRYQ